MTDVGTPVSKRESRLGGLSVISLALAVVGLLIPNRRPVSGADPMLVAIGIRMAFLLLAFVLGIFSRRSRAGRFAFISSGAVLAILVLLTLFLVLRHSATAVTQPTLPPP